MNIGLVVRIIAIDEFGPGDRSDLLAHDCGEEDLAVLFIVEDASKEVFGRGSEDLNRSL